MKLKALPAVSPIKASEPATEEDDEEKKSKEKKKRKKRKKKKKKSNKKKMAKSATWDSSSCCSAVAQSTRRYEINSIKKRPESRLKRKEQEFPVAWVGSPSSASKLTFSSSSNKHITNLQAIPAHAPELPWFRPAIDLTKYEGMKRVVKERSVKNSARPDFDCRPGSIAIYDSTKDPILIAKRAQRKSRKRN